MISDSQTIDRPSAGLVLQLLCAITLGYETYCHAYDFQGDTKMKQGHLLAASSLSGAMALAQFGRDYSKKNLNTFISSLNLCLIIAKLVLAGLAHSWAQEGAPQTSINSLNEWHKWIHIVHSSLFAVHRISETVHLVRNFGQNKNAFLPPPPEGPANRIAPPKITPQRVCG